ncbi:MAG: alcohol dehydrogenase catalytic domain-containing protein, partial [Burkholderiales bacterium]
MQTRAALFRSAGQPLVIETLELEPPGPGEITERMKAVGLCRSDYNVIAGLRPVGMTPMVLGHEGAGLVEAVGTGVDDLAPGDAVVLTFITACGQCRYCQSGHGHACVLTRRIASGTLPDGSTRLRAADGTAVGQFCMIGAFSERVVVDRRTAIRVDPALPLRSVCLTGCGVAGGYFAATHRVAVAAGSPALVVGAGGVGMNVVQGLRHARAKPIIVADRSADRRVEAVRFGATHAVSTEDSDWVEQVRAISGVDGVDAAFVAVAAEGLIEQAA